MSVDTHLVELERRHAALEREIEEAMLRPGIDTLQVSEMKRRKLQIKDEIERLRTSETLH
jgi:hypothetical protein